MEVLIENPERADQVLREIDAIITWKKDLEKKLEEKMMVLANHLLEAYRNAYWIRRGFHDESEFIESTFPKSRSLYYDLIRIAKTLNHYEHRRLNRIGIANCRELCKIQKAFEVVPANWFEWAETDTRDEFKKRVKEAITGVHSNDRDEVTFVTLSFVGDQIYDFNEATKIAMMEAQTDKLTEAVCVMARDFLSGYRDDGKGKIQDRNAFLIPMIGRLYQQIDRNQANIYQKLITQLATWVEKGKDIEPGPNLEEEEG